MDYMREYEYWLTGDAFDEATKRELAALTDPKEIEDRFYKNLAFGTGGLRGVIGAGTNRMNVYTVGKATQGLADFINSQGRNGSVVVAYDSRRMSPEFALDSALILAANGIKVFLFESLRPTPELSFAVRELGATAGIVITASHNPPQYNGYKVYWSDGGQIVPPYDKRIIEKVNAVADYASIQRTTKRQATERGLLVFIGEEIDRKYIEAVKNTVIEREELARSASGLKIVYTPLNGTGFMPVTRVLNELGFSDVTVVPEQSAPDGNFPTLKYPNPEDPAAFALALGLAKKNGADLVLATDPDADRLGVYAKDARSGEYMPFTGNMSGLLIAEYRLSRMRERGLLPARPKDGALVTTVVSSDMAYAVADEYGLSVIEVLTGFKYIGEQIRLFEEAKKANGGALCAEKYAYEYLFGFEESYGCLVGTYARDKDAVAAVTALCEAAAYYRARGLTLCDVMRGMYEKYGWYKETLFSVTLAGADGAQKISSLMDEMRKNAPRTVGGCRVAAVRDYLRSVRYDFASASETAVALPVSNVLYFELEGGGWCCVRPSGTEPKIKFYAGVKADSEKHAEEKLNAVRSGLTALVAVE